MNFSVSGPSVHTRMKSSCGSHLQSHERRLAQFPFALPLFVIAGLDPAIQLLTKKMDPRVKPAGDDDRSPVQAHRNPVSSFDPRLNDNLCDSPSLLTLLSGTAFVRAELSEVFAPDWLTGFEVSQFCSGFKQVSRLQREHQMSKWWTQSDQDQKGAPCRRRGQRQAKIRIAQKMAMTIKETSHSAMILTPADRLQRRHDYMEKARTCRAIIEKLCPQPSGK